MKGRALKLRASAQGRLRRLTMDELAARNCKGNPMTAISCFLRTTIVVGAFFLMPIVVLVFLLNKAFGSASGKLKPVARMIPDQWVSGTTTETIMAIGLIVFPCFLAGLFARTLSAQRMMSELESAVLSKVPAYDYLKQAGSSMMGLRDMVEHPAVGRRLATWRSDRHHARRPCRGCSVMRSSGASRCDQAHARD
jgi:hypothetical protein